MRRSRPSGHSHVIPTGIHEECPCTNRYEPDGGSLSEVLPAPAALAQVVSAPRGLTAFLDRLIGEDPVRRAAVKGLLVRALVVLNVVLGTRYMLWRAEYT